MHSSPTLLVVLLAAAASRVAMAADPLVAEELGWGEWLTQSFYHASVLPMLVTTAVMAYKARPSTTDEFPAGFRRFQLVYLSVWALCVAADWLQGPFVYALYSDYGFDGKEIAELFVAGFGSSLVFGCFVGTFADKFGRKLSCLLYCLLYIISCTTKHFKSYRILMVGRITGGIATSMLFSCFECWMVSEHTQRNGFPGGLLGYMFGLMFTVMYLVAIASGLAGQAVAEAAEFAPVSEGGTLYMGGKCGPFDLAIACLVVALGLIAALFEENYGQKVNGDASVDAAAPSLMDNITQSVRFLMSDRRALLLGVVVSTFEGSMYAFVFNWTPALNSKITPPPHGVIFALFMMACMCGASMSTLLGHIKPGMRLTVTFAASLAAFALSSYAAAGSSEDYLRLSTASFVLFEFCVGVYFPSVGVLKSDIVPEQIRGTVYNLYRMPLNAIVVGLLLSNISMATCFKLNAVFMLAALVSMSVINSLSTGEATGVKTVAKGSTPRRDLEKGKGEYEAVQMAEAMGDEQPLPTTTVGRRRLQESDPGSA